MNEFWQLDNGFERMSLFASLKLDLRGSRLRRWKSGIVVGGSTNRDRPHLSYRDELQASGCTKVPPAPDRLPSTSTSTFRTLPSQPCNSTQTTPPAITSTQALLALKHSSPVCSALTKAPILCGLHGRRGPRIDLRKLFDLTDTAWAPGEWRSGRGKVECRQVLCRCRSYGERPAYGHGQLADNEPFAPPAMTLADA